MAGRHVFYCFTLDEDDFGQWHQWPHLIALHTTNELLPFGVPERVVDRLHDARIDLALRCDDLQVRRFDCLSHFGEDLA